MPRARGRGGGRDQRGPPEDRLVVAEALPAARGPQLRLTKSRYRIFSKGLYIVILCSKYNRALTFENVWSED